MAYVALYRSWRPRDFSDIVGQDHIKTALTNALETGRISHAYLFTGPRGTGKTSTARILAKALNCEKGPTIHPCNACTECREISEGTSADVIEIDAASNRGIDEIRQLRDQVHFAPVSGRYKIYIIDEVHMITPEAFNALLKTLEEPPEHVIFIMATTEPQKVPVTIQSRVQRYDFRRVSVDEIASHLAKVARGSQIEADPEALRLIAIQADGGLRDAVSLLDQCSVMESPITARTVRQVLGSVGRETLRALVAAVGKKNLPEALDLLTRLTDEGKDVAQILTELMEYLRALLLFQADPAYQEIYLTDTREALEPLSALFTRDRILAATQRIHEAFQAVKVSTRRKIVTELCLFDLCRETMPSVTALMDRVAELEEQVRVLSQGGSLPGTGTVPVKAEAAPRPAYGRTLPPEPPAPAKDAAPEAVKMQPSAGFSVPAAPPAGTPAPAAASAPAVQRAAAAASAAVAQKQKAPHAAALPGGLAAGQKLWRYVYEGLKKRGKRTFLAYAEMARVMAFDGQKLTVGVTTHTGRDRIDEPDFRNLLLDILKEATGRDLDLQVILAEEGSQALRREAPDRTAAPRSKVPPEMPAKPPETHSIPAAEPAALPQEEVRKAAASRNEAAARTETAPQEQEELPETVRKALQVFGGKIVPES